MADADAGADAVKALRLAVLLGLAAAGSRAVAGDVTAMVAPYLAALDTGRLGTIEGRAFDDARRPGAPAVPNGRVSLLALPYAPDVEAQLDAVKAHQRDSMTHYADAYTDLAAVRTALERDLLAAGGGQLIRGEVSGADGMIRLDGVPAGEWLVLGWQEQPHQLKSARAPKDSRRFAEAPVPTGYVALSYWKMRVTVRAGETTAVDFSDRGVWLTVVKIEVNEPAEGVKRSTNRKRH